MKFGSYNSQHPLRKHEKFFYTWIEFGNNKLKKKHVYNYISIKETN